jgi:hypothetical protein
MSVSGKAPFSPLIYPSGDTKSSRSGELGTDVESSVGAGGADVLGGKSSGSEERKNAAASPTYEVVGLGEAAQQGQQKLVVQGPLPVRA